MGWLKSKITKTALSVRFMGLNSTLSNLYFNEFIEGAGKVFDLKIDFKEKKLRCKIDLKGEEKPLEVNIDGFELFEKDGSYFVRIGKLNAGKEWIQALADNLAAGKVFQVPKKHYDLIRGMFE